MLDGMLGLGLQRFDAWVNGLGVKVEVHNVEAGTLVFARRNVEICLWKDL
jgi:hypothetical protein